MEIKYKKEYAPLGFTLIELLVVIGIIGILSSTVLLSYKDYNQRAKLSNTMQWSKSVHSSLGAYAIGAWGFDSIEGTTVFDETGNSKNGTLSGAVQVNGIMEKALEFDGINDFVQIDNLTAKHSITIILWLKSSNYNNSVPISLSGDNYSYGPDLLFRGNQIFWNTNKDSDNDFQAGTTYYIDANWHHFAVVADYEDDSTKIFIDGNFAGQASYQDPSITNGTITIGMAGSGGGNFPGIIDDVKIYNEVLDQAKIQQYYSQDKDKKDKKDK
ncbi:MAG: prepilin-type N-terminal cleavage/methylation domain-containing protein [Candidatus Pacebacteria bacterium]|nr:prepilin-type N-terminal cleavage/methylation domain-containing protein [Candidatus Paceibacterota bacterium]